MKEPLHDKKLIEIASEIVQTQVSLTSMSAADIASSLRQVFSTLCELQKAESSGIVIEFTQPATEEVAATTLSPADSIQNDKVICLECGAEMRQLSKRSRREFGRRRWQPNRVVQQLKQGKKSGDEPAK
jgi:predicted transcriptional regulator